MTYLQFHLLFNLPPLLGLLFLQKNQPLHTEELWCLGLIFGAVALFTSPWDNYAAKKGIWGFPPSQHSFKIKYLPIEEYAFFFIQSLLVILSIRFLHGEFPELRKNIETTLTKQQGVAILILLWIWIRIGLFWRKKGRNPKWNYTFHLFYWFSPVVLLQWILGPSVFLTSLPLLLGISLFWGVYYTLADLVATRQGIWHFDEKQIQGYKIHGILPWEESAFFWLTSLLVAQSYLLLLPPSLR